MKNRSRNEKGQFLKGNSGNPSGRPKKNVEIEQLAQDQSEKAIAILVEIMNDKLAAAGDRIRAATAILDRGYGKPTAPIPSVTEVALPRIVAEVIPKFSSDEHYALPFRN